MPPEWVVAAILLATRFRLREISVPPGAATMEVLGALAPALTDTLIRWTQAAVSFVATTPAAAVEQRQAKKPRPRGARAAS